MRCGRFTSQEPAPWGRQLGRALDPIDARFGVPVEVVGGYAREVQGSAPLVRCLDAKKEELRQAKKRAKQEAIARAKEEARRRLADKVEGDGDGSPSLPRLAGRAAPWLLGGLALLALIYFTRKG